MAYLLAGGGLLILTMLDILLTMVGANKSSPVAMRVGKAAFDLFKYIPLGAVKHRLIGPAVMTVVASYWITALAVAWSLIFYGIEANIDFQAESRSSGPLDVIAHVGHLLSTVGGGVSRPQSTLAALLGVLIGVNGMVVLTLSVSFVLSTTSTVMKGRQLFILMDVAEETVDPGDRFFMDKLTDFLAGLSANPLALYFSHENPEMRIPRRLARLITEVDGHAPKTAPVLVDLLPGVPTDEEATLAHTLQAWVAKFDPAPQGRTRRKLTSN